MTVEVRAMRQAVSTSASGTQDFNVSGWSTTPQLAMFIISKATADNSLATDAELAIGFTDGTDEYYCARNEMDGDVWADANRRTVHNACIGLVTDEGAVDGEFTFSQWNSGGVELTINEQFSAGFLMTVIFFAGFDNVDIQKVDKVGSPGATVTTGFQTDIVFMISNDCPADDTAYINSVLGISMAVRGSGFGTFSSYDADASSSSVVRGGIADDYFHMQAGFSPGIYYDIGNFTSTSFDIQYVSGGGDPTDDWIVVSLDLPSDISAWCGADTSPTTATTKSNTSPGFTPQCLFGILSDHSAIDDWNGDSEAGVLALAFANQDGEDYCTSTHNEWGAGTMNAGSLTDDVVVHMLDDTGSDELVATIDSWDANGWTLDYSTADGTARYALWLAIEEDAAESASESPSESPSISPSASESPSESPSESASESASESPSAAPPIEGSVAWGHDTEVTEDNIRDFLGNWTGTGAISGSGDAEVIELEASENMISEVVNTGASVTVTLLQNEYDDSGDDVTLEYRHGSSVIACEEASWNSYTVPFESLGYVQIRIISTL